MTQTKICRFAGSVKDDVRVGLVVDHTHLLDLSGAGISSLASLLEQDDPEAAVDALRRDSLPGQRIAGVTLRPPVEKQEVWAAGVTYLRSKTARMEESDFSATAYDKVYDAERPELFFKSIAEKVVPSGEPVGIRRDARWNVPEPELALVMNSRGTIVGFTIGNDMSSRDIEGEGVLYLPQAKIYERSCALGPWITLGKPAPALRDWTIGITILRDGKAVFAGDTSVRQIKRSFDDLAEYLFRCQSFPYGAVLLTGTGIVPPDTFTLEERDEILIEVPEIGILRNTVVVV
jgi:2-dehydro-3-deoxy-D-arabinonate dehydratase